MEDLHLQSISSSTEAEDSFHLDLVAANLIPSYPSLMADADDNYLSLGMADPNDVLREDADAPYRSRGSIFLEDESESSRNVQGFLTADEVELYLGTNCPSLHVIRSSNNEELVQPCPNGASQLLRPHQTGPSTTQHHGAIPNYSAHWSLDFLNNTCQPNLLLERPDLEGGQGPGAGHYDPEVSRSNAPRKKGARHRHKRQFLPEEEKQQRGRQLNNEASQIYRQKRKERNSEEQQQLEHLEKQNHDLNNYYSLLKKYREVVTKYQGYLPTAPDPAL